MTPAGTGVTRLTFRADNEDGSPAWAPDGRRIARQGDTPIPNPLDKPVADVWTMAPDGSEKASVTGAMRTFGRFPDEQPYPRPGWQRVATAPTRPAPAVRPGLEEPGAYLGSSLTATVYLGAVAPARRRERHDVDRSRRAGRQPGRRPRRAREQRSLGAPRARVRDDERPP